MPCRLCPLNCNFKKKKSKINWRSNGGNLSDVSCDKEIITKVSSKSEGCKKSLLVKKLGFEMKV